MHHRYGSEAKEVADNLGGSVKHAALVYIDARGVGRKALLKSVGKSALRAKMVRYHPFPPFRPPFHFVLTAISHAQADGSELYLSNENGELHQIEASVSPSFFSTAPLSD